MRLPARHHQFALVDPLDSPKSRSQLLQSLGGPSQRNDLQAHIVLQMDVQVGYDVFRMVMLQPEQFLVELRSVVVVDQRERPSHLFRIGTPCLTCQRSRGSSVGSLRCAVGNLPSRTKRSKLSTRSLSKDTDNRTI